MSRFHGFRNCAECDEGCTPGNFVDHEGKRYCTACWITRENPKHESIDEIRTANREAAGKWKCQKYSREEGPLPVGPQSVNKN